MPPKFKFTRDEIIASALEIAQCQGIDAVTARDVGAALGTSSKPVYTAFENMSELKGEVILKARKIFKDYSTREIQKGEFPEYKAMGVAYIRFAAEQKNLFKLLFMRSRGSEEQLCSDDGGYYNAVAVVGKQIGIDSSQAQLFHTEMWIFTHGIATILASSYLDFDFETISKMLTDVYTALKNKTEEKR